MDAAWTLQTTRSPKPEGVPALLRSVRAGSHPGFDRVVFEFAAEVLPGYEVEYIDKPAYQCGSGEAVFVPGDAWLEVRLVPAMAHTDEGKPTVQDRKQVLSLPQLAALHLTCDFEAHVNWVIGVRSPRPYRVLALTAPARLVVDVRR